ncbi:MAG: T9SS C-terminal target domain-containing protein [Bacteroidetes bacterium]|nr:MAG: T9SS C-terminal target domain-containing protein [Bacteroidota bacterium]
MRLFLLICLSTLSFLRQYGQGTPDTSFGEEGYAFYRLGEGRGIQKARRLLLQPDGKIVMGGMVQQAAHFDFGVVRLLPGGRPDASFGREGRVTIDFEGGPDVLTGMALLPDGRLLCSGYAYSSEQGRYRPALCRLLPDGRLDADFGAGGKLLLHAAAKDVKAECLILRKSGKIALAGQSNGHVMCMQLTSEGEVDRDFGHEGWMQAQWGTYSTALCGFEAADGRLFLGGMFREEGSPNRIAVLALTAHGQVDEHFGRSGRFTAHLSSGNDLIYSMAGSPEGELVIAGESDGRMFAGKLSQAGVPLPDFGQQGFQFVEEYGRRYAAYDLMLGAEGQIVLTGTPVLAALTPGGQPDTSFGEGGLLRIQPPGEWGASFSTLLGSPDGKILTAGTAFKSGGQRAFSLLRLYAPRQTAIAGTGPAIRYYPNPFHSSITVTLSMPDNRITGWQISNLHGQLLSGTADSLQAVSLHLQLPASWPEGMYFLQLHTLQGSFPLKLFKKL